ncbi:MAG TPA: TspO/MBR family protein [Planctomycetota bacterium]|nr:TspO/MBR family protein [Planctomycetota bacterium]
MRANVNWRVLVVCLVIVWGVAGVGSLSSRPDSWYESVKPSFTPPNWVFAAVWAVLFFLIVLSMYLSWTRSTREQKPLVAILFAVNLLTNMLWTYFFFTLRKPGLAMVDLVLIWLSALALIIVLWKIERRASLLLVPYVLWVSFAGALNLAILF